MEKEVCNDTKSLKKCNLMRMQDKTAILCLAIILWLKIFHLNVIQPLLTPILGVNLRLPLPHLYTQTH
jgi:hypothetical protein